MDDPFKINDNVIQHGEIDPVERRTRQRNYGPKDPDHGLHALMLLPGIPVTRNADTDLVERSGDLTAHYVGRHRHGLNVEGTISLVIGSHPRRDPR